MDDNELDLIQRFRELVERGHEGEYWDYKQQHHATSAALIHDVLCLANAEHRGDRYILYGVAEEGGKPTIVSVEGTPHRRTQADVVTTIHAAKYYEGRAPEVALRTLAIDGAEVDLLIIFDKPHKPYVLAEDTKKGNGRRARAHHIYTRIGDRNTAPDESAPPHRVEQLWRERFGLTTHPRERMRQLLRGSEWDKNLGNRAVAYHRVFADYRIEFDEDWRHFDRPEPYCYFYASESGVAQVARFYYNATELFRREVLILDGMRRYVPTPESWYITLCGEMAFYYGYLLDSVDGDLAHFFTDGTLDFQDYRGGYGPFALFHDDDDRRAFESNVEDIVTPDVLAKWKRDRLSTKGRDPSSRWEPGVIDGMFKLNKLWFAREPLDVRVTLMD